MDCGELRPEGYGSLAAVIHIESICFLHRLLFFVLWIILAIIVTLLRPIHSRKAF